MITRKDVALAAGVSEATVSRVLNGVGPMREDTKQRVLQVVNEMNYHPNAIAQSFARNTNSSRREHGLARLALFALFVDHFQN